MPQAGCFAGWNPTLSSATTSTGTPTIRPIWVRPWMGLAWWWTALGTRANGRIKTAWRPRTASYARLWWKAKMARDGWRPPPFSHRSWPCLSSGWWIRPLWLIALYCSGTCVVFLFSLLVHQQNDSRWNKRDKLNLNECAKHFFLRVQVNYEESTIYSSVFSLLVIIKWSESVYT